MEDSNDLESLGFHSIKVSKVCSRGTSPVETAIHHYAADEGIVGGSAFRHTKEGLCMKEDAQSVTGSGGQL